MRCMSGGCYIVGIVNKINIRLFCGCPTGLDSMDNIDYTINYTSYDHDRLKRHYKFG